MKAIVWTQYGPPEVLVLKEIAQPIAKDNEILVKIHATTAFPADGEMRAMKLQRWVKVFVRLLFGLRKPRGIKMLGQELAGEIVAVGKHVTRFKKGCQVFANTEMTFGAYAQYICLPEQGSVAIKPATISYDEAAALPVGGINALHFVAKANIQRGDKVLVNGSGGCIGTYMIQLLKSAGAQITAVDSADKLNTLLELGANKVIDYTQQDFNDNGQRYDVIFDVVGKGAFSRCLNQLKPNGRLVLVNPKPSHWFNAWKVNKSDDKFDNKKVVTTPAQHGSGSLVELANLVTSGKLKVVIDRRYPLEQTVEAHHYLDSGDKVGHIILTVKH
jgi:NADPH:quinone reductase-like Zn-dependent oxidoreductase